MMKHAIWLLALLAINAEVLAANCSGASAATQEIKVTSNGTTRTVPIHFGAKYDGRKPLPLVLDLHASGSSAAGQARISGLGAAADRHGFVVAWPEGSVTLPTSGAGRFWNIPGIPLANGAPVPSSALDDTKFIADLIAQLTAEACIDSRAVFVTGLSGGARMSSHLGCQLSDRIAAIAPVAGLRAGKARAGELAAIDSGSCAPKKPVAVVAFHGTDDAVNSYTGSSAAHWGYAVPVALQKWADADGCKGSPERTAFAASVSRLTYRGCRANTVVELYLLETSRENGGGHSWPGSTDPVPEAMRAELGLPSRTVDATEIMSRFFVTYRAPGS